MSMLSSGFKKVAPAIASPFQGLLDPFLNFGSKPGVQNPFGVPNLDFLRQPVDLTKGFKPIDTSSSDALFQELLNNINAPSSVDKVQSEVDSDKMQQLLEGIDQDTTNQVGSLKSDFLDRGLSGPGMISDIEAAGLGDLRGNAVKARAGARTNFANSELARLKAKEDELAGAYGARYSAGLDTAKTNSATWNDLLKGGASLTGDQNATLAKLLTELYTGGQKNQIDTMQPGFLDSILRNIKINVGGK